MNGSEKSAPRQNFLISQTTNKLMRCIERPHLLHFGCASANSFRCNSHRGFNYAENNFDLWVGVFLFDVCQRLLVNWKITWLRLPIIVFVSIFVPYVIQPIFIPWTFPCWNAYVQTGFRCGFFDPFANSFLHVFLIKYGIWPGNKSTKAIDAYTNSPMWTWRKVVRLPNSKFIQNIGNTVDTDEN